MPEEGEVRKGRRQNMRRVNRTAVATNGGAARRPASFNARPLCPRRSPMPFQLPDLPYAKDALAPHMSAETLEFHHGKHHKAYVTKTNALLEKEANLSGASLIEVVRGAKSSGNAKLFNNSAQLWNHSFFWQCLAPAQGQKPGRAAGAADQRRVRRHRDAAAEAAGGSGQPFRQRLGVACARPRQTAHHFAARCRHAAGARRDGAACSRSMCGSTLITSTIVTSGPRFASTVLANIVNWDFVAQNLDGRGFRARGSGRRADAGAHCLRR